MGKASRKKKAKPERLQQPSFSEKFKTGWNYKHPVLLFSLGLAVLLGIFYALWNTPIFRQAVFNPVVLANAWLASKLLNLMGFHTTASGADLHSSLFSLSIKQGCDALEPIAIYVFMVLLFPVSFRTKPAGIAAGVILLLLLNQFRILTLYLSGVYAPALFDIMHIQVLQVLFILFALMLLVRWVIWAMKRERQLTQSDHEAEPAVS